MSFVLYDILSNFCVILGPGQSWFHSHCVYFTHSYQIISWTLFLSQQNSSLWKKPNALCKQSQCKHVLSFFVYSVNCNCKTFSKPVLYLNMTKINHLVSDFRSFDQWQLTKVILNLVHSWLSLRFNLLPVLELAGTPLHIFIIDVYLEAFKKISH